MQGIELMQRDIKVEINVPSCKAPIVGTNPIFVPCGIFRRMSRKHCTVLWVWMTMFEMTLDAALIDESLAQSLCRGINPKVVTSSWLSEYLFSSNRRRKLPVLQKA